MDYIQSIVLMKIPEWVCVDRYVDYIPKEIVPVMNYPEIDIVSFLFFGLASMLGILIVEFVNSEQLDRLLDPICNKVEKRYSFVKERERLLSMNGHP